MPSTPSYLPLPVAATVTTANNNHYHHTPMVPTYDKYHHLMTSPPPPTIYRSTPIPTTKKTPSPTTKQIRNKSKRFKNPFKILLRHSDRSRSYDTEMDDMPIHLVPLGHEFGSRPPTKRDKSGAVAVIYGFSEAEKVEKERKKKSRRVAMYTSEDGEMREFDFVVPPRDFTLVA